MTFSIELGSKVDIKAKKQDSLLSLTQQRLDFYKPLIHLEESPNCQTLKSSSQPLLPTMGNNLLAVNEPKRNKDTKLVEKKIKTRKTESTMFSWCFGFT